METLCSHPPAFDATLDLTPYTLITSPLNDMNVKMIEDGMKPVPACGRIKMPCLISYHVKSYQIIYLDSYGSLKMDVQ